MDMGSTGVKFSGGKIVPHSVLRAGTTSGNPWQKLEFEFELFDDFIESSGVPHMGSARPLVG